MPYLKFYKYDESGRLAKTINSYSDKELSYNDVTPPKNTTSVAPPIYDEQVEIPVWNGKEWVNTSLDYFNRPEGLYQPTWENNQWVEAVSLTDAIKKKCLELLTTYNDLIEQGLETSGVVTDNELNQVQFKAKIDSESVSMWQLAKSTVEATGQETFPIVRDWNDVEYEDVPATEIIKIATEVIAYRTNLWVRLAKLQKLVKQQVTVDDVKNITWYTTINS